MNNKLSRILLIATLAFGLGGCHSSAQRRHQPALIQTTATLNPRTPLRVIGGYVNPPEHVQNWGKPRSIRVDETTVDRNKVKEVAVFFNGLYHVAVMVDDDYRFPELMADYRRGLYLRYEIYDVPQSAFETR